VAHVSVHNSFTMFAGAMLRTEKRVANQRRRFVQKTGFGERR